jgi:N-acetylneuraminic acid mutarotase/flagellar hook assembly protein FlgD
MALGDSGVTFDEPGTVGWLLAQQGPDGSFGRGDVRDTALAAQALRAADRNVSVADVIVSDPAPRQGGVVRVTAIVANDGETDLDACDVDLTAASGGVQQDLSTFTIPSLSAGTSTTVSYNFDTRVASGTVGFTASVSTVGTVFETNEADNSRSASILVRTALLAPTPIAPGEEAHFGVTNPTFAWLPPADGEGGSLTYVLQLDRSRSFNSSYARSYAVPGAPGTMVTYQLPAVASLGDGTWFWRVRVTEDGIDSPWCSQGSFIVDKTAPVMAGLSGTPSPFSPNDDGRRDRYRATFQISESCIGNVEVLSSSGQVLGFAQNEISIEAGHVSFDWDGTLVGSGSLADGTYRLRIRVLDEAGNAANTTTGLVTLDTTPPSFSGFSSTATSISPNGDGYYDKVTHSWSKSTDGLVTVRVVDSLGKLLRVDQTQAQAYTWEGKNAQNLVVPSGEYSLRFVCEDEAGNAAEQVVSSIRVKTACLIGSPRIEPLVVRPGEPVQITIPVQDDSDVTAAVQGVPLELTKSEDGESYIAQIDAPSTPGNYPVAVEARDSLRNLAQPIGSAIVVRTADVNGSLWTQDTRDDFMGAANSRSTVDSVTIESRPGSIELSTLGWEQLADMPYPAYGAQTCLGPDGQVYVMGGMYEMSGPGNWTFREVRNTQVLDPLTGLWSERTPMPSATEEGRAVFAPNGKIYVIGGNAISSSSWAYSYTPTGTVECYDPETDTWERDTDHGGTLAPMPTARSVFGAVVGSDGRIYCFGGYAGTLSEGGSTDVTEVYDPMTNTWETKAPMPQRECCFAEAGVGSRLYVIEGEYNQNSATGGGSTRLANTWSYDTLLDSWTQVQSSPVARTDAISAVGRDGRVYVYGGSTGTFNGVPWNYGYSPLDDDWIRASDMPMGLGRERTQGVSDASGRPYAIGGSTEYWGTTTHKTVARYDPYYQTSGTFVSQVKDTYLPSSFGAITWDADVPDGTELTLATRTSVDNIAWSPWSEEYLVSGSSVTSPVGRSIQYRVTMRTSDPLKSPRVDRVVIVHNGSPSTPVLHWGNHRTQTPLFSWMYTVDPEMDPVTYDLQADSSPSFDSPGRREFREIAPEIATSPSFQVPGDAALNDGDWWVRVRASDGRAQSPWSDVRQVRIDSTPPDVRITSVDPTTLSVKDFGEVRARLEYSIDETAHVRLNVMPVTSGSGLDTQQYNIYNVTPGTHLVELDGFSWYGQPLSAGAYRLELSATDSVYNQSVVDQAPFSVRRAPRVNSMSLSTDSSDPQASCEGAIAVVGDATSARMKVGPTERILVDSNSDKVFTGKLADAAVAGVLEVTDMVLEDGLSGYGTPSASGRLTVPGYVPGAAWRESSQADLADGKSAGLKVDSGALSLDAMKWRTEGHELLSPRWEATSAQVGSKVYVIGGVTAETQQTAEVIDLRTGERSAIAPPTFPRRGAAATAGSDGRVYVFGGYLSGQTGEVYDPVSNTWQAFAIPTARYEAMAFTGSDGCVYLAGGISSYKTVEALDPTTMTWSVKQPLLTGVSSAAGTLLGDKYYLFGGFTGSGMTADVQIYDTSSGKWSYGPTLPAPWYSQHVQKSTDGLVYIFGRGMTWGSIMDDCQCWSFDPASGVYAPRERPVLAARRACSASLDGTIYLIGGYIPGGPTPLIEAYNTSWQGSYVSSTHDAGQIVDWGVIGWTSFEPSGTSVAVKTRSSIDGDDWSDWSDDCRTGDAVTSAPGRFIQYKVNMGSSNAPWVPSLGDLTIGVNAPQTFGLTTPMPLRPWSDVVFEGAPELTWASATGGLLPRYEVQVDQSPHFDGSALRTFADVPDLNGSSVLYLPSSTPLDTGHWYWRVRASDGFQESDWSPVATFQVVTKPATAVRSLEGTETIEEGRVAVMTAHVVNRGAPAAGCIVRFRDATSGELVGSSERIHMGYDASAAITFEYPTQGKSGIRTLTATIETPGDTDPTDDTATIVLNVAPHGLSASVCPDRMTYSAEDTASLTVIAVNDGTVDRDVQVKVRVVDHEGVLVEDVGEAVALRLAADQIETLPFEWHSANFYPGDYSVQVVLVSDGRTCSVSEAPIRIAEDVSLSGRVSVGRLAYEANDRVQVSSRVTNASRNSAFTDLLVRTRVLDPMGVVLASSETTVPNLLKGESRLYGLSWDVADAQPGAYKATEEVILSDGSVVVSSTVGFDVLSSAQTGAGLSAALEGDPDVLHEGESCTFAYTLANDGNSDMDVPLSLSIVDPEASGTVLAQYTGAEAIAKTQSVHGSFAVDTSELPRVTGGGRRLLAVLQGDVGGYRLTLDSAHLQVLPVSASATLTVDSSECDALSSVAMTATVSNETTGYALDGVEAELQIQSPDGSVVHSESRLIAHLPTGEPASEVYEWETGLHAPGTYEAKMTVSFDGMLLSTASAEFVVLATAETGTGLSGQLSLAKRDLFSGETLKADFVVRNEGNSDVSPLQTVVLLEDALTGEVLAERSCPISLPRGEIASGTATFSTDGILVTDASRRLIVRLQARAVRSTLPLDSTDATVQQGLSVSVTKQHGSMARVLVWCESDGNKRAAEKALYDLGAYYAIIDTPSEFIAEMRSGVYDTLVILDTKRPLPSYFDEEVAERVNSGATLIGTRWANMDDFKRQGVFGVRFRGFLSDALRRFSVPQSRYTQQRFVDASGRIQLLEAEDAQVIASWEGHPVITANQYGRGAAVLFGFDLGCVDESTAAGLLHDAIGGSPPDEGLPDAEDVAVVEVEVVNHGAATAVQVDERVVNGQVIGAVGTGSYNLDSVQWTRLLEQGQSAVLRYLVRLDGQGAPTQMTTSASAIRNGSPTVVGSAQMSIEPRYTDSELFDNVIARVSALTTTSKSDAQIKERALRALRDLQDDHRPKRWGEYGWAIWELVRVCGDLERISADTTDARLAVDELMRLYEARWYQ